MATGRAQPDLLNWVAPEPVAAFEPREVAAASLNGRLARAVSAALKDQRHSRDEVAERMSEFLGIRVSKHMLDAYASQAREETSISAVRLAALVHATGDRRLLEVLAELFGWAVIERRWLTLIDLAAVREQADALMRSAEAIRRQAKQEGLL